MASIAPTLLSHSRSSSASSSGTRSPSPAPPPHSTRRSPSISSSSSSSAASPALPSPGRPPSEQDELADDDDDDAAAASAAVEAERARAANRARAALDPWTRRALKYGFDPAQLQPVRCEWGNGTCGIEFWEVEPLVEHVHNVHAFPQDAPGAPPVPKRGAGAASLSYICDWAGCPRRGKHQGSKFALVAHLRSHTGEKPFICPRAECDKSFTRTDALQKHMRVQHGDKILAARAPAKAGAEGGGGSGMGAGAGARVGAGSGAGSGRNSKGKGRGKRAGSDDSAFGGAGDESLLAGDDADYAPGGLGGDASVPEVTYSPDELQAMHLHSDLPPAFVAHVVAKAKSAYVLREHEQLAAEYEALSKRERELEMENEVLLRAILRREVGAEEDAAGRASLEQFLTSYAHTPRPYPDDWVAGK